jgi:hypothetical protein
MSAKAYIWIGVFVFSTLGSWLGAMMDHGSWFGGWSIALGAVGAFVGIWAGYKLSKNV